MVVFSLRIGFRRCVRSPRPGSAHRDAPGSQNPAKSTPWGRWPGHWAFDKPCGGGFRAAKTPSPSAASGDGSVRAPKGCPCRKVPALLAKFAAARQTPPPAAFAGNQSPGILRRTPDWTISCHRRNLASLPEIGHKTGGLFRC